MGVNISYGCGCIVYKSTAENIEEHKLKCSLPIGSGGTNNVEYIVKHCRTRFHKKSIEEIFIDKMISGGEYTKEEVQEIIDELKGFNEQELADAIIAGETITHYIKALKGTKYGK